MNACWDQTDRKLNVKDRQSTMMMHAGVAVTITNVTDILSFAIGCYTQLPGIQLFCMYACSCVFFCYIYQLTYFAGFMAIMGNAEVENRHCLFFYKLDAEKVVPQSLEDSSANEKKEELHLSTLSVNEKEDPEQPKISKKHGVPNDERHATHPNNMIHKFFSNKYAPFLMKNEVRAIIALLYIVYAYFTWTGCMTFKEGLEPGHLVTDDHYIAQYFEDMKMFWKVGPQLHVAVLKPPNFIDPVERFD